MAKLLRNCLQFCTKLNKPLIQLRAIHYVHYRQFQTCSVVCYKIHGDHESNFAHNILKNNEKYVIFRSEENIEKNTTVQDLNWPTNQNWNELTLDGILNNLQLIGCYCKDNELLISDERFDEFIDTCTERCFDFTDDQLIKALQILINYSQTKKPNSRNFVELWSALDDACVERIPMWDADKILYVCDHWYALNLGRVSKFFFKSYYKIGRKIRRMEPHHVVQIMFYGYILHVPVVEMIDVETNLIDSIDKLSINEIAIVCMGFFKTQTTIKNVDLITTIYQRLIQDVDTVQDIPLVSILKSLKFSSKLHHTDVMVQFLNAVSDQLQRLNLISCVHVTLLSTRINICQSKNIETICHRFAGDLKSLRLRDIEYFCHVIALFDFESESRIEDELCKNILADLKNRVDYIVKNPKSLPFILHYITMKGFSDAELISVALKPSFLKLAYGNQLNLGRHVFSLDAYVQINLKDTYTGNVLSEKQRRYMGKMLSQYLPNRNDKYKLSATDTMLLEMKEASEELFKFCYLAHVLPHFDRPDLIIAYDKTTKTGIDISQNFPDHYSGKVLDRAMLTEGLNINSSDVEMINFIIVGENNYERSNDKLNGLIKLKMEQSKLIGFHPVLVPWFDWRKLIANERQSYIQLKLSNAFGQK